MGWKTVVASTGIIALVATLCLFQQAHQVQRMMAATSSAASTTDLQVTLQDVTQSDPLKVRLTVRNNNPSTTLSFLSWDSVLDDVNILNTGILTLVDTASNQAVEGLGMKVNRLLPPPRDALIELKPGSEKSRDISLTAPWIPNDGRLYRIQASGSWKAVWSSASSEVGDDALGAMIGPHVLSGPFKSNAIEIRLS